MPSGARISGAKIAFRIVVDVGEPRRLVDFSLPRTLRAVRGNEHPLAPQWVVAAMRKLG